MTTDFRDIRPPVESSRLPGDPSGPQRSHRRSQTVLDNGDNGSTESHFGLPSARAERGALLERQLLISGGLEDRRLAPTLGRGSRLPVLLLGLLVVALAGAGWAFYVHYQNARDQWHAEMAARNQELAAARADNDRLLSEQRETERRLELTAQELAREASGRRLVEARAESSESELKLARQELLGLRSEFGTLRDRYGKLEKERLAELGAFLQASLRLPLRLVLSLSGPALEAAPGPLPRAAPLVESPPPEKTDR